MRKIGIAPRVTTLDTQATNDWFQEVGSRMNVYTGAADPTTAQVPLNQWIIYTNTTLGETRTWANIAGVMKKSAAYT